MNDSTTHQPCPGTELLERVIENGDTLVSSLAQHVDTCVECQNQLERLSDSAALEHYHDVARTKRFRQTVLGHAPSENELGSFGQFTLESRIGSGGMGVVYRAQDEKLGRTVAIKVLTNVTSPTALARFDRESHSASLLNHPNVVPIYFASHTDEGHPYLVMPLIEGDTLKRALAKSPLNVPDAAQLTKEIADGLHAAHQAGLIHRDVKPANILLDQSDGKAKLADFGLVRGVDDKTLTRTEILCGTPEYMSPEQANGLEQADVRSDIYGLGITLYESLTGTVPFRGRPLDVLAQHREHEPVPPSRLNNTVPRDLEVICLKAIEKDPQRRYESAALFADDLQRFLDGERILAVPASNFQKSIRWAKRNPRVAGLSTLLAASLIIGLSLVTWQWQVAKNNFGEAQQNFLFAQQNFDAATELVLNKLDFAHELALRPGQERSALDLYNQLVDEVSQLAELRIGDPGIRILQAVLFQRLATLECEVGNAENAIPWFDRSIELYVSAAPFDGDSDSNKAPEEAASVHGAFGLEETLSSSAITSLLRGEAYHQIGDTTNALADYDTAKTIWQQYFDRTDANQRRGGKGQRDLALIRVLEGHVWAELNDIEKAFESYESAYQSLPDEVQPKLKSFRDALRIKATSRTKTENEKRLDESSADHIRSFADHFLGRYLVATATHSNDPHLQTVEGIDLLKRSLVDRRRLLETVPSFFRFQRDVAVTLTELARAASQLDQLDSSAKQINEAVEILEQITASSDRLEPRLRLAQALVVRGKLSLRKKDPAAAANEFERAVELCKDVLQVSPFWAECQRVLVLASEELANLEIQP